MLQFPRPRCMQSWLVLIKFMWKLGQRNNSVFVLTVSRFWKPLRLQEQRSFGTSVAKGVEWHFHYHSVGMFWVPGRCGLRGNVVADRLAREGAVHQFVGPEFVLRGGGRWAYYKKKGTTLDGTQYMATWRGLSCTQRNTQNPISAPVLLLITG